MGVIGGVLHNTGFNGIIVYVNHAIDRIAVVGDGLAGVSVAEDVAHSVFQLVVGAGVAGVHPMHEAGELLNARRME